MSYLNPFQKSMFPTFGSSRVEVGDVFSNGWNFSHQIFQTVEIFDRITGCTGFETETFLFPISFNPVILST